MISKYTEQGNYQSISIKHKISSVSLSVEKAKRSQVNYNIRLYQNKTFHHLLHIYQKSWMVGLAMSKCVGAMVHICTSVIYSAKQQLTLLHQVYDCQAIACIMITSCLFLAVFKRKRWLYLSRGSLNTQANRSIYLRNRVTSICFYKEDYQFIMIIKSIDITKGRCIIKQVKVETLAISLHSL